MEIVDANSVVSRLEPDIISSSVSRILECQSLLQAGPNLTFSPSNPADTSPLPFPHYSGEAVEP